MFLFLQVLQQKIQHNDCLRNMYLLMVLTLWTVGMFRLIRVFLTTGVSIYALIWKGNLFLLAQRLTEMMLQIQTMAIAISLLLHYHQGLIEIAVINY